jgi:hypothetical protein
LFLYQHEQSTGIALRTLDAPIQKSQASRKEGEDDQRNQSARALGIDDDPIADEEYQLISRHTYTPASGLNRKHPLRICAHFADLLPRRKQPKGSAIGSNPITLFLPEAKSRTKSQLKMANGPCRLHCSGKTENDGNIWRIKGICDHPRPDR